jgi:hypothetical protein
MKLFGFLLATLLGSASPNSLFAIAPAAGKSPFDAEMNGLKLTIAAANHPQAGPFTVALQNTGEKDIAINLGYMFGNGGAQFPDAIHLIVLGENGTSRDFLFADKRYPGSNGVMDDFIVPLRSGSTYTLVLPLNQFWCRDTDEFELKFPRGHYRIAARYYGSERKAGVRDSQGETSTPLWKGFPPSDLVKTAAPKPRGVAWMPLWKGTLQSEYLDFQVAQ